MQVHSKGQIAPEISTYLMLFYGKSMYVKVLTVCINQTSAKVMILNYFSFLGKPFHGT